MAVIDFPASPATGQSFTAPGTGITYVYNGTIWVTGAGPGGGTGDFSAWRSGGPAITPSTITLIPNQIISGNAGLWYSTSTGRYTPPAGRYHIDATFSATANLSAGATTVLSLALRKNASFVFNSQVTTGTGMSYGAPVVSMNVDANGTDYFDLQGSSSGGNTIDITLISFNASPLTGIQGPAGPAGVTQMVSVETGAVATGTTIIPYDDTIPQITEGDQYMTLAITPRLATSRLLIEVVFVGSSSVTNNLIIALFQDATANALAATTTTMPTGTSLITGSLRHVMTSGTTSSTTFRVRAGGNNAGTTTFNGNSGNRNFGGVMASSIVITEVS